MVAPHVSKVSPIERSKFEILRRSYIFQRKCHPVLCRPPSHLDAVSVLDCEAEIRSYQAVILPPPSKEIVFLQLNLVFSMQLARQQNRWLPRSVDTRATALQEEKISMAEEHWRDCCIWLPLVARSGGIVEGSG